MKNIARHISRIAAVALTTFCALGANVGEAFPDLNQFELEGSVPDLKDKVVLVDFFASWCGPCKMSFPVMQELQAKYGEKGFVVLAVNVDRKRADMERFVKKEGV